MATDEMITPSSVSLNVSEMGGVEAGAHLRGIVLLVGPCPRKDEPRTTRMEEGVEPHFNDVPSATPVVVSGTFRFYDKSFIVVRDDRPVPFLRFGTIAVPQPSDHFSVVRKWSCTVTSSGRKKRAMEPLLYRKAHQAASEWFN
jgi:hypothetical protein